MYIIGGHSSKNSGQKLTFLPPFTRLCPASLVMKTPPPIHERGGGALAIVWRINICKTSETQNMRIADFAFCTIVKYPTTWSWSSVVFFKNHYGYDLVDTEMVDIIISNHWWQSKVIVFQVSDRLSGINDCID